MLVNIKNGFDGLSLANLDTSTHVFETDFYTERIVILIYVLTHFYLLLDTHMKSSGMFSKMPEIIAWRDQ